ncbi:hypothetical protein TNCV_3295581 [Trichonephila clavipes]|uniref:Uncharacterized protein n=1 Tax=Trichonephila clavipes TaxID=2585209 RepID=A0A8X6SXM6_TRICX|nr:hypothetical protein TNCV_3295581 [Trichonephila clavipes]
MNGLIEIGINQDVSWSTNEWIRWIGRDGLDSWVVVPIDVTEEVNCNFSDTLSDAVDERQRDEGGTRAALVDAVGAIKGGDRTPPIQSESPIALTDTGNSLADGATVPLRDRSITDSCHLIGQAVSRPTALIGQGESHDNH